MSNIIKKLTSRKLWMAVAGVATGIAMVLGIDGSEITAVAGAVTALVSVATYIITEGKVDAAAVAGTIELVQDAAETIEGTDS